jgi:hypothetical protein
MHRLALVVVVAGSVACGGSGGDIPVHSLSGALQTTYCEVLVRCGLVDTMDICVSLNLDFTIDADLLAAVDAGKVIYHADKARECVDSLFGSSCSRTSLFDNRGGGSQACDDTFQGTVGDAGACALNEECISQQCTIPTCAPNTCCQGMCVGATPPSRMPVGSACGSSSDCLDSYCDLATSTCTTYLAMGATCMSTSQCDSALVCTMGTCQVPPGTGSPCTNPAACNNIGDTCSTTSMTCVAVGLMGDPCTTASDCSGIYACDATSHCVLGPQTGEACSNATAGQRCIDHSYCDTTTNLCTTPKADGQPCTASGECRGGTCDQTNNLCATPPICI